MAESTSLYRRHRPLSFGEVVGQEHVVRTLSHAIERDRVHHAYLFVGSRGTGKTSMAKILARSLNCVEGPTLTPCGVCEPCTAIAAGHSIDVIEMDAASNRSVDDIRELRERVGYAPAEGRSKVYILDEAHMLTKEAWNAFLKTLEEPPPNTVFVLATTEANKVMPTIVDRCQRFDFQRPSLEQIGEVVKRVSKTESIDIEDGAVALISRAASGSFRDALGTLDQLTAFGTAGVKTDDVIELLGAADADMLFDVTDAIAGGDAKGVLEGVEQLSVSGRDPAQFARDLIGHLRQLLVARTTGKVPDSFTVTLAQPERLAEQAGRTGPAQLVGGIDALSAAVTAMREGDDPRLSLEVALLKVAQPTLDPSRGALLRRIEQLEQAMRGGGAPASAPAPPAPPVATAPAPAAAPVSPAAETPPVEEPPPEDPPGQDPVEPPPVPPVEEPHPPVEEPTPMPPAAAAQPAATGATADDPPAADLDLAGFTGLWPAVVDHVRDSGAAMLASVFESARPIAINAERSQVKIGFPPAATFNKRKAETPANAEIVAEAIASVVGRRLSPVYELSEDMAPAEGQPSSEPELGEEEMIELIKSNFDASEIHVDLAPDPEQQAAEGEAS